MRTRSRTRSVVSGEMNSTTQTLAAYPPIGDYAVIGDTRTAALVSRDGSVDWLCLPRFDSPSVFAGLLDRARGGRFRIAPAEPATATRHYVPDTNVLETVFRTDGGELVVRDAMTLPRAGGGELLPDHELLREVECRSGSVAAAVDFEAAAGLRAGAGPARGSRPLRLAMGIEPAEPGAGH